MCEVVVQEALVPPAQCPQCARFLARSYVLGLATEPAGCPRCGTRLSPAHFPDELGQAATPAAPAEEPADAAALRDDAPPDPGSPTVRAPDPVPDDRHPPVAAHDPLAGWDRASSQAPDRQPPPDAAILAGTGMAGGVLGALVAHRRGRGALLGLLLGLGAAATARQVWRLPD